QDALLFQPNSSRVSGMGSRGFTGQNPDPGPRVSYLLNSVSADSKLSLSIVDAAGTTVRELPVNKQPGMFRISWDMRVGPPLTGPVDTLALQRAINPSAGRGGTGRGGPVANATGGLGGPGGTAADTTGRGGAPAGGGRGNAP